MERQIQKIITLEKPQLFGDFDARNIVPNQISHKNFSPFVRLDNGYPNYYKTSQRERGVFEHPHTGTQIITLVLDGEMRHRDNLNNDSTIQGLGVHSLVTGGGVKHHETFGENFNKQGGLLHFLQIWLKLPSQFQNIEPFYEDFQNFRSTLKNELKTTVISGFYNGIEGIVKTFSEVNIINFEIKNNSNCQIITTPNHNSGIMVTSGAIKINGVFINSNTFVLLETSTSKVVKVESEESAKFVLLEGLRILGPVITDKNGFYVRNSKLKVDKDRDKFRKLS